MPTTTRCFACMVEPSLLAREWFRKLMDTEESSSQSERDVIDAATRSLPLLEDASSVPFVCRYRMDVISPLTTQQVHLLHKLLQKHAKLAALREKLLGVIQDDEALRRRIQTCTEKSELEELYAPFKPPSKGSILERIQNDHPELCQKVDALWDGSASYAPNNLSPKPALVHLLATKIAAEPIVMDTVTHEMIKHCRIKCTTEDPKYRNYNDFSVRLSQVRDHQVLAIRRGVEQKAVKTGYDIDATKMESCIRYHLNRLLPNSLKKNSWRIVVDESIHDAWTRILRRRGCTRLWSDKCKLAEERAGAVFEENLHRALLAPPLPSACPVLAMDPGFQAGIKCAVLDSDGSVLQLSTIHFLGAKRDAGIRQLGELLLQVKEMGKEVKVVVALGNGHGSQEGRALIEEAAGQRGISIDIQLVNEAGASVWSVTEAAKDEFPDQPPAAIAAASIGRRLQNPLHELVKVPPRSLGLGMYQHDLSEKELDEKLDLVSVDAVATVGVDVNSCSMEILRKVPGLAKLATKVVNARPLQQRRDLLNISGLGPKTFENCAAFCRIARSSEPLDSTLVHPESYELARWLLRNCGWQLSEKPVNLPARSDWKNHYSSIIEQASAKFDVSRKRVLAVMENLVDSITRIDPRLRDAAISKPASKAGSLGGCILLSAELNDESALQKACPVRGIVGTIRNISDFGAFVDFGGFSDGLLHTSKLGPVSLQSLLIGEQVGIDILAVDNGRVSLALSGLGLEADARTARGATRMGSNGAPQRRNFSSSSRPFSKTKSKSRKRSGPSKVGTTKKRCKGSS